MKFYEFIEKLQEINKDKIVLIKSGVFFNSCGRDAIILGKIFNLKRTCKKGKGGNGSERE